MHHRAPSPQQSHTNVKETLHHKQTCTSVYLMSLFVNASPHLLVFKPSGSALEVIQGTHHITTQHNTTLHHITTRHPATQQQQQQQPLQQKQRQRQHSQPPHHNNTTAFLCSSFVVRRLSFVVRSFVRRLRSSFGVRRLRSSFGVRRSSFVVQTSRRRSAATLPLEIRSWNSENSFDGKLRKEVNDERRRRLSLCASVCENVQWLPASKRALCVCVLCVRARACVLCGGLTLS